MTTENIRQESPQIKFGHVLHEIPTAPQHFKPYFQILLKTITHIIMSAVCIKTVTRTKRSQKSALQH